MRRNLLYILQNYSKLKLFLTSYHRGSRNSEFLLHNVFYLPCRYNGGATFLLLPRVRFSFSFWHWHFCYDVCVLAKYWFLKIHVLQKWKEVSRDCLYILIKIVVWIQISTFNKSNLSQYAVQNLRKCRTSSYFSIYSPISIKLVPVHLIYWRTRDQPW